MPERVIISFPVFLGLLMLSQIGVCLIIGKIIDRRQRRRDR